MDYINKMYAKGYYLVLWSAAGEDHARAVACRLGLSDKFIAILTKPEMIVDDLGAGWAKYIKVLKA